MPPEKESNCNVSLEGHKGGQVARKGFTPEQIISKLREAEVHISQGVSIAEARRKIGITQQTYHGRCKEYNQASSYSSAACRPPGPELRIPAMPIREVVSFAGQITGVIRPPAPPSAALSAAVLPQHGPCDHRGTGKPWPWSSSLAESEGQAVGLLGLVSRRLRPPPSASSKSLHRDFASGPQLIGC